MPTYEYACPDCGHQFEVQHGFSDKGPRKCPSCGKMKLRKVFHPVGIVFKGSGFYKTDSRGGDAKSDKKSETKADTTSDTKTATKSDTKASDTKAADKKAADKKSSKQSKPSTSGKS